MNSAKPATQAPSPPPSEEERLARAIAIIEADQRREAEMNAVLAPASRSCTAIDLAHD